MAGAASPPFLAAVFFLLTICSGANAAVARIEAKYNGGSFATCGLYGENWGRLQPTPPKLWLPAVLSVPQTGCTNDTANVTNSAALAGKAAMFLRGCPFSETVLASASAKASAVVILNTPGRAMVSPGANNPDDYAKAGDLPVVMLSDNAAVLLMEVENIQFRIWAPSPPRLDGNSAIFWLLAMCALVSGSIWNTSKLRSRFSRACQTTDREALIQGGRIPDDDDDGEAEDMTFTVRLVGFFLVMATVFLVLLYYFYEYLVYVVIVIFVLIGASSLQNVLETLAGRFLSGMQRIHCRAMTLPYLGRISRLRLLLFVICYGIAVCWAIYRHDDKSWVLQDLMGVALLISALSTLRLPTFRVGTLMLVVFFFYDIFFVFVTPHLTHNHDSVMVTAATGGGRSREVMPLVLRLPRLSSTPCFGGESLLGFGDVIIPGLAISHALTFDYCLALRDVRAAQAALGKGVLRRFAYFFTALAAYTLGLALTFTGLALMDMAQPALMYLCPSLLLCIWGRAWWCGHVGLLWHGVPAPDKEEPNGAAEGEDSEVERR